MNTSRNSALGAQNAIENGVLIQSPKGNMFYFPNEKDLMDQPGNMLRLHARLALSVDDQTNSWPYQWGMRRENEVILLDGVIPLDYTMDNYTFPKDVAGVRAKILEYEDKWVLYFRDLGKINYLPESGIAFIQGDTSKKAKVIYQAIYEMYERNCTMVPFSSPIAKM